MAYISLDPTPDGTPLRIKVVECSTPYSEVRLGELQTPIRFDTPPMLGRYQYASNGTLRARLRCLSRLIWLTVLVVIVLSWSLSQRSRTVQYEIKQLYGPSSLVGLQFIDATHPYLRVGRQFQVNCSQR
jgi:hypothetical protein